MTISYLLPRILVLPAGIVLTIITILRMRSGKICLPQWAKILLVVGMILSQIIVAISMMPPSVGHAVEDLFIETDTHPVAPLDPSESVVAPDPTK